MRILKTEQGNPNYDYERKNNGGGYDQPIITFEHNGIVGIFRDTSCGDFGTRYNLEYGGVGMAWGSMYEGEDTHPDDWDKELLYIFSKWFGLPLDPHREVAE